MELHPHVAAALAPFAPPAPRAPELLGWNAILDGVASQVFGCGVPMRTAVRPFLFDLLHADVEFDYDITTSKEFREAVNAFAAGASVDWNAVIPELLLRHAAKIVRSGLDGR